MLLLKYYTFPIIITPSPTPILGLLNNARPRPPMHHLLTLPPPLQHSV
eukprot:01411.XXX_5415_5558_1 [CDS] Oithona nana genome sequencing.